MYLGRKARASTCTARKVRPCVKEYLQTPAVSPPILSIFGVVVGTSRRTVSAGRIPHADGRAANTGGCATLRGVSAARDPVVTGCDRDGDASGRPPQRPNTKTPAAARPTASATNAA